eukprot:TRINITY_DN2565_c0_g2_i1.p1 TRINITY_DN2565_c0_g2~~TRINITY_DN2565_c0_g2_i1.p1  ORF type:complete len:554 (-),score=76.76 TRINITY_DN2565_c0_g2_i1:328-1938(-)
MAFRPVFRFGLLLAAACGQEPSLEAELEAVLAQYSELFNTSYSVAVRTAEDSITAAAGTQDHAAGQAIRTDDKVPVGSVTKAWTAVAIVRMVEAGKIGYNDTVASLIDPFLMRTNSTTLFKLWADERINHITVYQLLHMSSGLADYDDDVVRAISLDQRSPDISPYDYLYLVDKNFLFEPGHGGAYSSVGYELLGYVLAAQSNASTWQDYDQLRGAIPEELLSEFSLIFAKGGSCEQYKDVVHQYTVETQGKTGPAVALKYVDIIKDSCLNGWAFGNLLAHARDIANFFYFLLAAPYRVLPPHRLQEMMHFEPFTTGFAPGLPYGLGLMASKLPTADGQGELMIGHAGQDYGSGAPVAHFFPAWNVSVAIVTNTLIGMNCSLSTNNPADFQQNVYAHETVACKVLDAVLQNVSKGKASKVICNAKAPSSLELASQPAPPQQFQVPGKLQSRIRTVDKFSTSADSLVCRPYCGYCDALPCRVCKACVGRPSNPFCAMCYKTVPKLNFACLYEDGHGCQQCWADSSADSQAVSDTLVV